MNLTLSTQTRAIALAAALVAVALGLGMLALSHLHSSAGAPAKEIKPLYPAHRHVTPAAPVHAKVKHATPVVHPKVKHATPVVHPKAKHATPVVHPKVTQHPLVVPGLVPLGGTSAPAAKPSFAAANGLPKAVARALRTHDVVVVALYQADLRSTAVLRRLAALGKSPKAAIDSDSDALAEAAAGARQAGAGFVGVNVLSQAEASPLVALLGTLPDPAVLVYTAPDTLSVTLDGFTDRDTVAQAASNAAPALTTSR